MLISLAFLLSSNPALATTTTTIGFDQQAPVTCLAPSSACGLGMPHPQGWIGNGNAHNASLRPVTSHGRRKGGGGQGKGGQGKGGDGAFADGLAAWQVLSMPDYRFLKQPHYFRIDKWRREKNISWSMTLLLRHVNNYERTKQHPGGERAELGADGMMTVKKL